MDLDMISPWAACSARSDWGFPGEGLGKGQQARRSMAWERGPGRVGVGYVYVVGGGCKAKGRGQGIDLGLLRSADPADEDRPAVTLASCSLPISNP